MQSSKEIIAYKLAQVLIILVYTSTPWTEYIGEGANQKQIAMTYDLGGGYAPG